MTAAFLVRPGVMELREVPVPAPGTGEVLVRVEAALTCGTDIKTYRRGHARLPVPAPFGHEFAGAIAAVGAGVAGFREGDPIACVPTAPCGACRLCVAGRENLCADAVGRMVLGAYAEYVLLPAHITAQHLFHRPAHLSAAAAAALEPLACVVHGATRIDWQRHERAVIVGDGAIALFFARIAVLRGLEPLVLGRHEARLAVARGYGAATALAPDDASARSTVQDRGGADLAIECVGTPQSWRLASELTEAGGAVMLFGGCAAGQEAHFDAAHLHYDEVDHIGAFHYTPRAARHALDLLDSGQVDPVPLITGSLPLARLHDALERVQQRAAIKMAVVP
jgi:L-iditol 2-dehydrogenase